MTLERFQVNYFGVLKSDFGFLSKITYSNHSILGSAKLMMESAVWYTEILVCLYHLLTHSKVNICLPERQFSHL